MAIFNIKNQISNIVLMFNAAAFSDSAVAEILKIEYQRSSMSLLFGIYLY